MKKNFQLLLFASFVLITSCALFGKKNAQTPEPTKTNYTLKEYPKRDDYDNLWKQVEKHNKDGLPKSALEVVNTIFDKANAEQNVNQLIKASIHKLKYNQYLEEESYVSAIASLDSFAQVSKTPEKQIFHSMLAEFYWKYYAQNRWKFNQRTTTVNFEKGDIRTWSLEDIVEQVDANYKASLTDEDTLQQYKAESFNVIMIYGVNDGELRPTLYDFLGHRAIDFFKNTEPDVTRPAYYFKLDDAKLYNKASSFIKLKLNSKDTSSNKLLALKTFQKLTKFHLKTSMNREALGELELERLKFVNQYNEVENKEELYLKALESLAAEFKTIELYSEIQNEIAAYYYTKSNSYKPRIKGDEKNELAKVYKKKAHEIATIGKQAYPKSRGAALCKNLIITIESKNLNFVMEEAIIPNQLSKGQLTFRNVSKVYMKIIKLDFDELKEKRFRNNQARINYYNRQTVVSKWELNLPDDGNYNSHSVEYTIPKLGKGYYGVLASTSSNFTDNRNVFGFSAFWSTNISYVARNRAGNYELTILERKSGDPINNVKAVATTRYYDYKKREYLIRKIGTFNTNNEGYIAIKSNPKDRQFNIDFTKGKDRYNNNRGHYSNYYSGNATSYGQSKGVLFSDRSIYRPGQKVYFKGLVFYQEGNNAKVEANRKVTVKFFDVNSKEIGKKELATNEYGTVSGEFNTPVGVLNGQMSLVFYAGSNPLGSKYIRVEEYKRPKFEVSIDPIKGEYKLGDKIKVEGLAKAFAGNNIDGAKVVYRVTRSASFPWWCWYYYGYSPTSNEIELTNGNTETDENGKFEVEVELLTDKSVNRRYSPSYLYQITADITDINGETRSTTQSISVGYASLKISLGVPAELSINQENKFSLSTTNHSGEKIPTKGKVTVYRITEKPRLEKKKKWGNPDMFLISKSEHDKLFENRSYGDQSDYEYQEENSKKVGSYSFDTKKKENFSFANLRGWTSGKYKIEVTAKDKNGEEVKEIKLVTVYDENSNEIPLKEYFWSKNLTPTVEPGETASFLFGTKTKGVKVMYEVEHQGRIVKKEWITLNNEQKKIEIPVEEKHRGNFGVHVLFVKENKVYKSDYTFTVPFTNKELDVKFETFRNKLLPGQKEIWKLTLKGPKGDKVMAEMLATMYDASLDAFVPHNIDLSIYQGTGSFLSYNYNHGFGLDNARINQQNWNPRRVSVPYRQFARLNWFGLSFYNRFGSLGYANKLYSVEVSANSSPRGVFNKVKRRKKSNASGWDYEDNGEPQDEADMITGGLPASFGDDVDRREYKNSDYTEYLSEKSNSKPLSQIKARTNFNETAFFLPHLTTDKDGNISFEFEMPEALTKWKFQGLAHTKDMKIGKIQEEIITQKDLMVVPNVPRFLREGDKITISSKISNISDKDLNGTAQLFLFDALTNKSIDVLLKNAGEQDVKASKVLDGLFVPKQGSSPKRIFTVKSKQSTSVEWQIEIPFGIQAVKYKIVAQAGNFSDGEEDALPVLTNRMLVTESMPLPVKKAGTKVFDFKKLQNSGSSTSLKHHKVTLEYTSNPAWYVVQAMPYMMEYPYQCAEQTFTRFYANSLATHIMNGNPKIKEIVEAWKTDSPEEFLSNLEKNQELKAVILEQTPWVLDAKNETARKKRIAELFNLNKMTKELNKAMTKLQKMQKPSGGWAWFDGMKESRYITQHIATGMGHLDNLGVKNVRYDVPTWNMLVKAIRFLDAELVRDLKYLKRHHLLTYKKERHLSNIQIQYLYSRSFFKDIRMSAKTKEAFDYYLKQSKTYWLDYNNYSQGMIALANYRYDNDAEVSKKICASLKEFSIVHPELGMYWKGMMDGGYYWYQAPIETQALMIELFDVVTNDEEAVNELKTWLLKQKQTTDWKTTKATAEACYALLLNGTDLLANDDKVEVKIGNIDIAYSGTESPTKRVVKTNPGTGYFKTSWSGSEVTPSMGKVTVKKKKDGVAWGALYWQYFEDLDKITPHDTPLKIKKKLFIEKNTDKGKVLDPISENNVLNVGDKIIVRIEIEVDRNMEYIHMKDMRASGFEPINVLSRYKWQDGLGYYESTKDASTDFFMDYLPRGTYVFEYPLRASQKGNFSNGITSIQCMYAPEFGSHSEGIRVEVK